MTAYQRLAAAGLTSRRIGLWISKGYLNPGGTGGPGHPWEWTRTELDVALLMQRLVVAGFTPAAAAEMARRAVTVRALYGLGEGEPVPVDLDGGGLVLTVGPACATATRAAA